MRLSRHLPTFPLELLVCLPLPGLLCFLLPLFIFPLRLLVDDILKLVRVAEYVRLRCLLRLRRGLPCCFLECEFLFRRRSYASCRVRHRQHICAAVVVMRFVVFDKVWSACGTAVYKAEGPTRDHAFRDGER